MKTVKYLNKRANTKEENRITKFNRKHKCRFIIFNTIIKSKFSYVAAVLGHFKLNYIKKWEAIIYRLLKQLL